MFNNCKNKMYKRLHELYVLLYLTSYGHSKIQAFSFDSKLGKRRIELSDFHGEYKLKYTEIDQNYRIKEIFSVIARKDTVTLQPFPVNLTAKEIDLAIYEVEYIVNKLFKKHQQKQEYLQNSEHIEKEWIKIFTNN